MTPGEGPSATALRDEREDARRTPRAVRELEDADEDPGAERRQLAQVREALEVPDAPRVADLAVDDEVRGHARVDAQGVDAQPDGAALLDEEARGLRRRSRGSAARPGRWRSAPGRC